MGCALICLGSKEKKNGEKRRKILAESGIKGIRDECKNWAKVAENYIWVTLICNFNYFYGNNKKNV